MQDSVGLFVEPVNNVSPFRARRRLCDLIAQTNHQIGDGTGLGDSAGQVGKCILPRALRESLVVADGRRVANDIGAPLPRRAHLRSEAARCELAHHRDSLDEWLVIGDQHLPWQICRKLVHHQD